MLGFLRRKNKAPVPPAPRTKSTGRIDGGETIMDYFDRLARIDSRKITGQSPNARKFFARMRANARRRGDQNPFRHMSKSEKKRFYAAVKRA